MGNNSSEEAPLVSVLMTAYNCEKYIAEAIESVLASTFANFELIIVDDCSSDSTMAIAKSYELKDRRIKVFKNKINLGDYPNRNEAASFAKGKYLKYVDADDRINIDGLQYCVDSMEKYAAAGMGMLSFEKPSENDSIYLMESRDVIQNHFYTKQCLTIGPSGTIINNDKFKKIGGFDCRFGVASDMYFNLKMASLFPVLFLPKVFFYYRLHDGQQQNNPYGYFINGYLYQKIILEEKILPLSDLAIMRLKKKNIKRLTINFTKLLLSGESTGPYWKILNELQIRKFEMIKSLFY